MQICSLASIVNCTACSVSHVQYLMFSTTCPVLHVQNDIFSTLCSVTHVHYHRVHTFQLCIASLQVECSKNLLTSLTDEMERWEAGSETFKSQMFTITGDVLLTSAFMAYGGMRCIWDGCRLVRGKGGGGGEREREGERGNTTCIHFKEDLGWFSVFVLIRVLFLPTTISCLQL